MIHSEKVKILEHYKQTHEYAWRCFDTIFLGGGGAPVRDTKGRLMTDLRQMKVLNDTVQNNMDKV